MFFEFGTSSLSLVGAFLGIFGTGHTTSRGFAGVIFSWVFATSFLVWLVLRLTAGIRVDAEHEYEGVDLHECGLEAYPEFTTAE